MGVTCKGAITVKTLRLMLEAEEANGNGNKEVLISIDGEGNAFHSPWYGIIDDRRLLDLFNESGSLPLGTDVNRVVLLQ